jgi:DNA-binding transcriptional ArsR family regulator
VRADRLEPDDEVFAALADRTRRSILDALAARGEATATVLSRDRPVSRQAVVKHLVTLEAAGLVRRHRAGREVRYGLRPERLAATAERMARLAARWDDRLAALKRIAEASS